MHINSTSIVSILSQYSRWARFKILLWDIVFLICFALFWGWLITTDNGITFLDNHPDFIPIFLPVSMMIIFGEIVIIPFLLLMLIPSKRIDGNQSKSKDENIVEFCQKEHKKMMKNSRLMTQKERFIGAGIFGLISIFCFIHALDDFKMKFFGFVFLILGGTYLCPFIPQRIGMSSSKKITKKSQFFLAFSVFFAGVLLSVILTAGQLYCSRITNACEFQEKHLWNISFKTTSTMPISNLDSAYVQEVKSHDSDGHDSIMYKVVLKTKFGEKPLFHSSSSSHSTHQRRADKINSFLNSNQKELRIKESAAWLLIPFPFIILGALILFSLKQTSKK